jgi:predicted nucleic acid-binding protein
MHSFAPRMMWAPLIDADWEQTAHFWDDATVRGRQFSDIDLLVAAMAARLGGMIVSGDDDFDALPPPRGLTQPAAGKTLRVLKTLRVFHSLSR